ncbi:Gfo/Idh/MocA family oxidoreductase [Streptomyces sp. NPDC000594]|uniref:Gfo/Idh/MocA family oxidoreductase n=1 Tax=Streptomyces sp. NPDC000594 TaxID=3154261 RepID=UPI00331784D7
MTPAPRTCALIGFGVAARIHGRILRGLGVRVVAVLEASPDRRAAARARGLRPVTAYAEAHALDPDFWDVCTPTRCHVEVLERIHAVAPRADIVVEKPVCAPSDAARLRRLLLRHRGRIVVNENYASSAVTATVRERVAALGLRHTRTVVEMTKHRGADVRAGRQIDRELGAFGYEGPHLVTVAQGIGPWRPRGIADVSMSPLCECGDACGCACTGACAGGCGEGDGARVLRGQGGASVRYRTESGPVIELYTSMTGRIGCPVPPCAPPRPVIPMDDPLTRYRVVRVDGTATDGALWQVAGFYEPVTGIERPVGAVAVHRNGALVRPLCLIEDDTMTRHLRRALDHFAGHGPNPCPPERALDTLELLHRWAREAIHGIRTRDTAG